MLSAPIITTLIALVAIIVIVLCGYVKAPPDRAYIITGLRKDPKVLIGRSRIKIPFLQRVDKLYLGQMSVDIKTEQSVPTNDFINVRVDAVAKIRVNSNDTEALQLAAKNFLNKNAAQIAADLQDSLQGNMREIIGTLSLKARIYQNQSGTREIHNILICNRIFCPEGALWKRRYIPLMKSARSYV